MPSEGQSRAGRRRPCSWQVGASVVALLAALGGCRAPAPPSPPLGTEAPQTEPSADPGAPTGEPNLTPISFQDDSLTLHGVFVQPRTPGPHPVAVFVHGDGPAQRQGYGLYPQIWAALADIGVASVAWDSPGTGESEGDWTTRSFRDRAAEIRAAMDYAEELPGVDPTRIGLWGISQAGWVIALMAEDPAFDAAFVICVSCPGGTLIDQGRYLLEKNLRIEGFSESDVEQARKTYQNLREVQARPSDASALRAYRRARADHLEQPWTNAPAALALLPETPRLFGPDAFVDPKPLLGKLSCPVLAVYGELDSQVDPTRGRAAFEAIDNGPDVTVSVLPRANHAMLTAKTGTLAEMGTFLGQDPLPYADGYLDGLQQWLRSYVLDSPEPT